MPFSRRALLIGSSALATATLARNLDRRQLASARAVVREMLEKDPIPSLSIAVMRGQELIWAEAFGKADLEFDVAATTQHRFRLGSVSKIVTATLAAQLAARGAVNLDASIANYLPDLPEQHRSTTLRQLLTHRGGIRHYTAKDESPDAPGPIDRRRYLNNADILEVFINDPLIAKPGETVAYSTFGYTLASVALESAAKAPFLELVRREVAEPLGLSSLVGDEPMRIVPQRVSGYFAGDQVRKWMPEFQGTHANIQVANVAYKWAGGGLLCTPSDLARFGAAHLAPGKLSAQSLETLFTVYTERTSNSPPLGLGWRIDDDAEGRRRWHHAGSQDGARASLVVYPREQLSIAFAANILLPGDVNGPSARIADALI